MRLGLIVPTNNPKAMIKKFASSLHNLDAIKDRVKILINFQPPHDEDSIQETIDIIQSKGYDYDYIVDPVYPKPIKIALIRERAAMLDPDLDAYMICDDNFKFSPGTKKYPRSSGERYAEALDYMEKFPNCGGVQCMGFLGGYRQGYDIVPVWHYWFGSRQGQIIRNIKDQLEGDVVLAPSEEFLELAGGLEELMYPYARMEKGYFMAKQLNNPTVHIAKRMEGTPEDDMSHHDVCETNIAQYIRERYKNPEWKYDSKRSPDGLRTKFEEHGGNYAIFNSKIDDYTVSYSKEGNKEEVTTQ